MLGGMTRWLRRWVAWQHGRSRPCAVGPAPIARGGGRRTNRGANWRATDDEEGKGRPMPPLHRIRPGNQTVFCAVGGWAMGWGTTPGVCLPRPEGMLRGGLGCHVLLAALPGCGHQMAPRARFWIRTGRRCEFKHCRWVEQPGSSGEQGRRLGTCLGGTLWWANLQHEAVSVCEPLYCVFLACCRWCCVRSGPVSGRCSCSDGRRPLVCHFSEQSHDGYHLPGHRWPRWRRSRR